MVRTSGFQPDNRSSTLRGVISLNMTVESDASPFMKDYYLKVSKASNLQDRRERILYRIFEILPGFFSWAVLILAVLFSWKAPFWMAIFIISFVIFWLFRTIYFLFHLRDGYKIMKESENINWLTRLKKLEDKGWESIYHLVVFPMYKEPLE